MKDIQDLLDSSNALLKPNFRVIDKKTKEFALKNLFVKEKKCIFVPNDDVESGMLIFSCFVDDMKKIPTKFWTTIPFIIPEEEKETKIESYVPFIEKDDKKKVFDSKLEEVGKIEITYSKKEFLIDKLSLAFLENTFPKLVKRFSESDIIGIEEIIFLENKGNEEPIFDEQKQDLRRTVLEMAPKIIIEPPKITQLE